MTEKLQRTRPGEENDKDLNFLREKFELDKSDEEAAKIFRKQIHVSLNTMMTKINWFAHIVAHS